MKVLLRKCFGRNAPPRRGKHQERKEIMIVKRVLSITLVVVLVAMLFVGCGDDKKSSTTSIVGKWSYEEEGAEMVMEFKADGTLTISVLYEGEELGSEDVEYRTDGNQLYMISDGEESTPAEWSIKGNTLTITEDGESVELTRK